MQRKIYFEKGNVSKVNYVVVVMRSDLTICKQNNYLHEKQHLCIKYIFCKSVPHFAGRIKVKMLHG